MAGKQVIVPKGMETLYDKFHYAPAVKVGNLLLVSGQVGRDESTMAIPDGIEAQVELAFGNLTKVLAEAGASFADVAEIVSLHVNMKENLRAFIAVKDKYIPKDFPAWTAVGVAALAHPKLLIEVKCTAVLS